MGDRVFLPLVGLIFVTVGNEHANRAIAIATRTFGSIGWLSRLCGDKCCLFE